MPDEPPVLVAAVVVVAAPPLTLEDAPNVVPNVAPVPLAPVAVNPVAAPLDVPPEPPSPCSPA